MSQSVKQKQKHDVLQQVQTEHTVCRHGKGKGKGKEMGSQVNTRMMMPVSRRAHVAVNSRQAVQAGITRLSAPKTRGT